MPNFKDLMRYDVLMDETVELLNDMSGAGLAAGSYSYIFQIAIPLNIPPSVFYSHSGTMVRMRHSVIVNVHEPNLAAPGSAFHDFFIQGLFAK